MVATAGALHLSSQVPVGAAGTGTRYWYQQPNAILCPHSGCKKLPGFAAISTVSWTGLPCTGLLSSYSLNIIHPKLPPGFVLLGSIVQNLQTLLVSVAFS